MSDKIVSTFPERLRECLDSNASITATSLADKIGLSKQAISMYASGSRNPKRPTVKAIAETLNVDEAWLMGYDVPMERINNKKVNSLPHQDFKPVSKRKYKYLGEIACGEPIFADEQYETYIELDSDIHADFVLKAKGDSMINARIHDGDIVFIKEQPDVNDGEIAAVIIDDEATLKRVYKFDDYIMLNAENPAYKPIQINKTDTKNVRIIGKAISAMIYL
ncbi:LexA family transcriptional regulator [Anaerotignum sp.]|uniref:LexA family transcriptional regulator n=1 Tax=Anaerotignum sp. TaxID=2039241 RepID=UPI0027B96303|nr:LexA family transcriptional regulator [Anaerotignum sp.]